MCQTQNYRLKLQKRAEILRARQTKTAENLDVPDPKLQRRKLEVGESEGDIAEIETHYYRVLYFEAQDRVIKSHFQQPCCI